MINGKNFKKAKNIKLKKFEKNQKLIYWQNSVYKMSQCYVYEDFKTIFFTYLLVVNYEINNMHDKMIEIIKYIT